MPTSAMELVSAILRELLGPRSLDRDVTAIAALGEAGLIAGTQERGGPTDVSAAGYVFNSGLIAQTIQGCRRVVDFGSGTGVQLMQVAALHPETRFLGVDRSRDLLLLSAARARALGIENIEWMQGDITKLRSLRSASVDAVISTMTLHTLPDAPALDACLGEMARVLCDQGRLYIEDFGRLKSPETVRYLVRRSNGSEAFSRMYSASLHSAFTASELREAAARSLPASVEFQPSGLVPFLVIMRTRTAQRSLPEHLMRRLGEMVRNLTPRQQRDLRDLRLSFRFGGLRHDPFDQIQTHPGGG